MAASYEERRQVALARLHDLVAARRQWEDWQNRQVQQQYEQMKAEEAQRLKEQKLAEANGNKFWGDDAAKGASIGMGVGGGWGALAGAIIGTGVGWSKAIKQRQKEGESGGKAFMHTAMDTPFGVNTGSLAMGEGWKKATDKNNTYGLNNGFGGQADQLGDSSLSMVGKGSAMYRKNQQEKQDWADTGNEGEYTETGHYGGAYNAHPNSIDRNSPSAEQYAASTPGDYYTDEERRKRQQSDLGYG